MTTNRRRGDELQHVWGGITVDDGRLVLPALRRIDSRQGDCNSGDGQCAGGVCARNACGAAVSPHQLALERLRLLVAELLPVDPVAAKVVGRAVDELMRGDRKHRKRGVKTRLKDGSEFVMNADDPRLKETE
jgi:hypothetical protein